jgi:hypothetical protein
MNGMLNIASLTHRTIHHRDGNSTKARQIPSGLQISWPRRDSGVNAGNPGGDLRRKQATCPFDVSLTGSRGETVPSIRLSKPRPKLGWFSCQNDFLNILEFSCTTCTLMCKARICPNSMSKASPNSCRLHQSLSCFPEILTPKAPSNRFRYESQMHAALLYTCFFLV